MKIEAIPNRAQENQSVLLYGAELGDCPVQVLFDGEPARLERVLQGQPAGTRVRPVGGHIVLRIAIYGAEPGQHKIAVKNGSREASCPLEILQRKKPSREEEEGDQGLGYWRELASFKSRFGHIGYVPPGIMAARLSSLARLRSNAPGIRRPPGVFFSPVGPGTNWTPRGPAPIIAGEVGSWPAVAGRVLSIAIDPVTPTRLYFGANAGGVWRSTDGGASWSARTDDQPSLAIGALAIDPNSPNRVFAGTGELHEGTMYGGYFGQGLLYSDNFGDTWTQLAGPTFDRAAMTGILFDPHNTANHMFLACDAGIYESNTGGTTWNLILPGSASDLVLLPTVSGVQLLAAFYGQGLFSGTFSGSAWSWTPVTSPAFPTRLGRIALGQSANHPLIVWAAFGDDPQHNSILSAIAKSSDGGGSWSSVPTTGISPTWATNTQLYIAVHPNTTDTVFVGTVGLYRTQNGQAPWTNISSGGPDIVHTDQHALAFDPSNSSHIYVGCDGGVYQTTDTGNTWRHCNHGVSTLQLYRMANHPQWAAVLGCATQDNGGSFGTAAPAWPTDMWPGQSYYGLGGDGTWIEFDAQNPSYVYYVSYGVIYISSDGGQTTPTSYTIPSPAEWAPPFLADPANTGVCYAGNNTLLRSQNHAGTFASVTAPLNGNLTTIAIHPTNSNVLCVGTSQGSVYLVQRTGVDWTLPNVTTTDLTGPPLPVAMYISCVAMDSMGGIWVSFSAMLEPNEAGVFSEDHVYYLPAGNTTWVNRSAGLAQANPVNALAIDPTNDNNVFCGADTSVFQWDSGSAQWIVWDQGLPNSPVYQLTIHQPSRLIRAATFGRGVWERPIDPGTEPLVDIFLRNNILDSGQRPAPSNVPNPFAPSNLVWWWQSEDIKVDSPPFQSATPVTDDVTLANTIVHKNPISGQVNRFYAQVHNRGPQQATNVILRAFFAQLGGALPNLPSDFWTNPKPFLADPSSANWTAIGPASAPVNLEPGQTAVVHWDWLVPTGTLPHSCLIVLATCDQDSLSLPGQFNTADVVVNHNNITQKNLVVV